MNLFFLILAGTTLLVVFWVILLKSIAYLSGWHILKSSFAISDTHSGINYVGISGRIGRFYYNKILNISLSEAGLYLSVPSFFRFGHPTLLIPWNSIKNIQENHKILLCEVNGVEIGLSREVHNIFKSYLSTYS